MKHTDKHIELRGPGGLILELDADQIVPHDPGQGTPAMLRLPTGECGTYDCSMWCGNVDETPLTDRQYQWLESYSERIDQWYVHWDGIIRGKGQP